MKKKAKKTRFFSLAKEPREITKSYRNACHYRVKAKQFILAVCGFIFYHLRCLFP